MKWNFAIPAACAALLAVSPACPPPAHADPVPDAYDVVVYGGTAGGVAAAVQASRMGKRVALIEPTQHLGGMTTGGLSFTDTGWGSAIGGFAGDFYRRLGRAYGKTGREYLFEPKVATGLIESVVREASVDVIRGERLDLNAGVTRDGTRITAIHMESGRTFNAGVFIDATYEGDLMAGAGVSYHVGRESNATYGERFNGVQKSNAWSHQIVAPVDPYRIPGDPASGLLPGVSAEPPGVDGQGDHRIQAYNFRLILTDNPDNRRPWTAPEGYDPARYELLARYIESANLQQVNGKVLKISPIGHGKYDLNNQGGVSTDHIGANYDYPEGDYERRQEIIEDHRRYQQGLLYFLATDERVPESMREEMNRYGLTYDEFTDTDGWSHQLYIREARRMIGEYVMTEHEVMGKRGVDDPVGLASYTMDSHNTQRYVNAGGLAKNEGDIQVGVPHPYGVSYRSLTPDRDEVTNLIVPVALSSSHIAYGSMRMEPVFMILGQSAGTAAVQALNGDGVVQHVDYERLATRLREDGQRLRWGDSASPAPFVGTLTEDFNYGPDENRIDMVSYVQGGWGEAWGPARYYVNGDPMLNHTPRYSASDHLTYDTAGYANSAPVGSLVSGGAGAGGTWAGAVSGRAITGGMAGEIWLSALVRLDDSDNPENEVLVWLDHTGTGDLAPNGTMFIGLRGGKFSVRHGSTDTVQDGMIYDRGVTHLLLARLVAGEGGDRLEAWLDPDLLDLQAPALVLDGVDLFGDLLDGVGLSIGAGGGAIDALRLSNAPDAFRQVTQLPEPSAAAVVLLLITALRRRPGATPGVIQ